MDTSILLLLLRVIVTYPADKERAMNTHESEAVIEEPDPLMPLKIMLL